MKRTSYSSGIALFLVIIFGCIEPYDPRLNGKHMDYLVIEGFLNASDGIATVKLSRSLPVKSTDPMPPQEGAIVYLEDADGNVFPVTEQTPGTYHGTVTELSTQLQYRLVVRTSDEHEYVSDFTTIVETPPIDSVTWSIQRDGVRFEVTTHDPTNVAQYFKWKFTETYEYHAKLQSVFMFSPEGIVRRGPDMSITECWRTINSTGINIGSVKHLQKSVLSKFPLTLIPYGSRKLFEKYSILVEQQALTEDTYNYWSNLEKSTEHLGGLFDPLPSEVSGNIACTRHQGEKALGLFHASTVTDMRIFLSRIELPPDQRATFFDRTWCVPDTLLNADLALVPESTLLLEEVYDLSNEPIGYTTGLTECVDCTYWGGVTTKPAFWE